MRIWYIGKIENSIQYDTVNYCLLKGINTTLVIIKINVIEFLLIYLELALLDIVFNHYINGYKN